MSVIPIEHALRKHLPAYERFGHNFTWKASLFCTV